MSYQPNVQPICAHPQHGGMECGLYDPNRLRLCTNPEHNFESKNYAVDRFQTYFRPVWHRVAEWPKENA